MFHPGVTKGTQELLLTSDLTKYDHLGWGAWWAPEPGVAQGVGHMTGRLSSLSSSRNTGTKPVMTITGITEGLTVCQELTYIIQFKSSSL